MKWALYLVSYAVDGPKYVTLLLARITNMSCHLPLHFESDGGYNERVQ